MIKLEGKIWKKQLPDDIGMPSTEEGIQSMSPSQMKTHDP